MSIHFHRRSPYYSTPSSPVIEKDKVPVYPRIKDDRWKGIPYATLYPFVKPEDTIDLALVFAQDAGDRFEYITKDPKWYLLLTGMNFKMPPHLAPGSICMKKTDKGN